MGETMLLSISHLIRSGVQSCTKCEDLRPWHEVDVVLEITAAVFCCSQYSCAVRGPMHYTEIRYLGRCHSSFQQRYSRLSQVSSAQTLSPPPFLLHLLAAGRTFLGLGN